MVPLTSKLLALSGRSIRQIAARHAHHKTGPDFHDRYGTAILAGGTVFCASIWTYVCTQTGITWNLSPIGKITPEDWKPE
ncbi:cytochrome c oxidase subunit 7B, mitochondrial-like [Amblyraja radiata]|uniref:cytochrome c oxidase subunit 7B, mitochondrial-like n=1 Tax=Amblyraja radiata TaxID=386614 RepID=UPI0014034A7E|nr:cytochrome c oxidase subunit 7B, mitochondrial-like [Amblyraja radiata]